MTTRRVDLVDRKILSEEFPDGNGHPAFLLPMIVYSRDLADLPADRHKLKAVVLIYKIACVARRLPVKVFENGIDLNWVLDEMCVNALARKAVVWDCPQPADQV